MKNKFYPVYEPLIEKEEVDFVKDVVETGWVSSIGPYIGRFENSFKDYHGSKYATSTNSGTSALHLALLALGIQKGDEVIIPTLTFAATASAVSYTGAKPIFVDVELSSWCIDPNMIEKVITRKTASIARDE